MDNNKKSFKYYIFVVSLDGCPYSKATIEMLNNLKIKYKVVNVSWQDKEKYKTSEIQTFPQVYLKKYTNNGTLLLGGHDDLKKFIDIFINNKITENTYAEFQKKYIFWNKHAIIRLIELLV